MSEIELLPCPFCGSKAKIYKALLSNSYRARCTNEDCAEGIFWSTTPLESANLWDKRATPEADGVMEKAFAALADQLEAQDAELMQEEVDLWGVWEYIKENGGGIFAQRTFLGEAAFLREEGDPYFEGDDCISQAAEWVRQQEGGNATDMGNPP